MKSIVIDAFGGDYAPEQIVAGALLGLQMQPDVKITLAGKEDVISRLLAGQQYDSSRLHILPASEVIHTEESPVQALREKKDSSLVQALQMVATGAAQVLISSGSTGAVLSGATLIVKRISGVKRPALAPLLPTVQGGQTLLIDCGANVDSRPAFLQQFAIMGSAYCEKVLRKSQPRVGLLNNGTEANKGNELTKEAYQLLERTPIHFVGNCEAREALSGEYDVIVSDGFAGNVLLKSIEGTAMALMQMMKDKLMMNARAKLGAALAKPALRELKNTFAYDEVGGALLLGVKGGIIKTHGNAKASTIAAAIRQGASFIDGRVVETIENSIATSMGSETYE